VANWWRSASQDSEPEFTIHNSQFRNGTETKGSLEPFVVLRNRSSANPLMQFRSSL
jgi:hypothetical protein